jgi:murein DD-endopeptidase MepM/ murein hydrolase activator NlpD
MIRALAPLLMALASPAGAFELAFPAGCTLGQDCYIQQYHDHDPGPEATDYTCGPLSYDGHDGTDIALPTRADMAAGVAVLAAAPGVVKGLRDGVADAAPFPTGQDCGNGVVIDHGNGWETQTAT